MMTFAYRATSFLVYEFHQQETIFACQAAKMEKSNFPVSLLSLKCTQTWDLSSDFSPHSKSGTETPDVYTS